MAGGTDQKQPPPPADAPNPQPRLSRTPMPAYDYSNLPEGFRKTRSGAAFSPWDADYGPPIHAPLSFNLDDAIRAVCEREEAAEEHLSESNHNSNDELGDARIAADNAEGAYHAPISGQPPTPASTQAGPSAAADCAPKPAKTKEKFHHSERSKARRRKARALSNTAGEPGISKRPVKLIAEKRRRAAAVLKHHIGLEVDVAQSLQADNCAIETSDAAPIKTDFSMAMKDVRTAKTAYVGKRVAKSDIVHGEFTSQQLVEELGFDYVPWDGRQCRPIVDRSGRIFAVLAGRPRDPSWDELNSELQAAFDIAREAIGVDPMEVKNRRGKFVSVSCGVSYGGGQRHVKNLSAQSRSSHAIADALRGHTAVRRVANFGVMQLFAPRLHNYYENTMDALYKSDPNLRPNFPNNVFAALTFNLGPRTVSVPHTDLQNLPFGWCSITAAGDYDPLTGGHIVLWDLRMVIEFPPGSTILIPSALLLHSNAAIAAHERRYSFTQFSAGGLFRWVECGFRPVKALNPEEMQHLYNGRERWERGVALLSFWSEFVS